MLDRSLSVTSPKPNPFISITCQAFSSSTSSPPHPCCNHQTPNGTCWTSISPRSYTNDSHSAVRVSLRKFKSDHIVLLFKTLCLLIEPGIKSEPATLPSPSSLPAAFQASAMLASSMSCGPSGSFWFGGTGHQPIAHPRMLLSASHLSFNSPLE